jgi:exodeoxyribonuclease V alpha subunit
MQDLKSHNFETILKATGMFSDIDIHFARFIDGFSANGVPEVYLAAALVSRVTGGGDICYDLSAAAGTPLFGRNETGDEVLCPPLDDWLRKLNSSSAVGKPGEHCPLILDTHGRLYLYRYWDYENKLAMAIRERAAGECQDFNSQKILDALGRLFPAGKSEKVDWQQIASIVGVLKRFSVITGGPGSGKTYTIARLLALLVECTLKEGARIYLAAPTGKAAARLAESITNAKDALNCSDRVKNTLPDDVFTIHRLLKPITGTPYFHHNSANPLPAEVVVVDEASMVDLALMSKLIQALTPEARLLLIGDKDQLASVEAGSVLGDICDRQVIHGFTKKFVNLIEDLTQINLADVVPCADAPSDLQDCITVLQKSYRFTPQSGIGGLSRLVNEGDCETAMAYVKSNREPDIVWHEVCSNNRLVDDLSRVVVENYRKYLTINDPVLAMVEFNRFKILCALKVGPFGAHHINALAEKVLRREGLLPTVEPGAPQWYRGRPVLITQNDYNLGLFNGDIGVTLPDPELPGKELFVYFPDAAGGIKRFPTHRLAEHETVYAMTVHKSQGSEFDHIILLLPEKDYPLLTRELIYTGLTRARKKVAIWGSEPVLKAAISRKIERTSGLRDALWN